MKITAGLPDIDQIFSNELQDIFPFNQIRRCIVDKVSGEIIHEYSLDDSIVNKFFKKDKHFMGVKIPAFYFKKKWNLEIRTDSIVNVSVGSKMFRDYDVPKVFKDGDRIREYIIIGISKSNEMSGTLECTIGNLPEDSMTLEEARKKIGVGRDKTKWKLLNEDVDECLKILFKFAFQCSKTTYVLGIKDSNSKSIPIGSTLNLGNKSGDSNPFINITSSSSVASYISNILCAYNGRLQLWNNRGINKTLKIANGKTLDDCIVEEGESYVIYSDGNKTAEDPIPEGIFFACVLNKKTGEIYVGKGYENLGIVRSSPWVGPNALPPTVSNDGFNIKLNSKDNSTGGFRFMQYLNVRYRDNETLFVSFFANYGTHNCSHYIQSNDEPHVYKYNMFFAKNSYNCIPLRRAGNATTGGVRFVYDGHRPEWNVVIENLFVTNTSRKVIPVKTKCPDGKIEFMERIQSTQIQEKHTTPSTTFKVSRDESNPENTLCASNLNLKITPRRDDLNNQKFLDNFTDRGIYPFNLIGRYILDKDTGEILERLSPFDSKYNWDGNVSMFDPERHDIFTLFFPFYAKREWNGSILEDSMLFEVPKTTNRDGYEVMPIFIDEQGKLRKFIAYGSFLGTSVNSTQLRSIPGYKPVIGLSMNEYIRRSREGRSENHYIETFDALTMIQFLYRVAFQNEDSQACLGRGYASPDSSYTETGGTYRYGNMSGTFKKHEQIGTFEADKSHAFSLRFVTGRLQFYSINPVFKLKTANNKSLEECIVEETDDYIIYSDGNKTAEDPIPEGICFACCVDKHTGFIYYGEGYTNMFSPAVVNMGEGSYPNNNHQNKLITLTKTLDSISGVVPSGDYCYGHKVNMGNGTLTGSNKINMFRVGESSIANRNMNGSSTQYYFWCLKGSPDTLDIVTDPTYNLKSKGFNMSDVRFQAPANVVQDFTYNFKRPIIASSASCEIPYVRTKCPNGKIEIECNQSMGHMTYVFKKLKVMNRVAYSGGSYTSYSDIHLFSDKEYSVDSTSKSFVPGTSVEYNFELGINVSTTKIYGDSGANTPVITPSAGSSSIKLYSDNVEYNRYRSIESLDGYLGQIDINVMDEAYNNSVEYICDEYQMKDCLNRQNSLFGVEDMYSNGWTYMADTFIDRNGINIDRNIKGPKSNLVIKFYTYFSNSMGSWSNFSRRYKFGNSEGMFANFADTNFREQGGTSDNLFHPIDDSKKYFLLQGELPKVFAGKGIYSYYCSTDYTPDFNRNGTTARLMFYPDGE